MKILFINGTNNIGGGELSLLSIAKHFKTNCSVMSFDKGDYTKFLEKEGIDSIVLKNAKELLNIKREKGLFGVIEKIKFLLLSIFEIRSFIKQYDIIYCNSQKAILLGLLASIFIDKKIIIHMRDMMDNPNISSFQRIVFKLFVFIRNPIIIANSKATKKALINIGIKNNIEVIYNGITLPIVNSIDVLENNNKFVVAMFSRISHWKGQEHFIEAIHRLKNYKKFKNMEFWIIGDAVMGSEEEKYKQKMLSKIKEYNLEKNVRLFGFVDNPLDYMQYIDVLLLPSIYPEPFGRVVVEAMLLKKVVIATNMGGVTEIIDHNENGFLVEVDNLSENIESYIIKLYNDERLYNSIGNSGYHKVMDSFSEINMLKNIEKIIRG